MHQVEIEDQAGVKVTIQGVSNDESRVIARMIDNTLIQIPVHLLRIQNAKSYRFEGHFSDFHLNETLHEETLRLPVIEERPVVHKKTIATGEVSIRKTVTEKSESIPVQLAIDEVVVERHQINQVFDAPQPSRHEGDVTIIPVQEEILVIEKKYRVREEVRISTKRRFEDTLVSENLRTENIQVERKDLKKE